MSAAHTPGPWRIDRHLGMIVGPDGGPITGEANYTLAATAPELLEALRGMVSELSEATLSSARAVIAKATGSES